jgi:hypothetical protein
MCADLLDQASTVSRSDHCSNAERFLDLGPCGAEIEQRLRMEPYAGVAMAGDTKAERDQLLGLAIERAAARGRLPKGTEGLHDVGNVFAKAGRDLDTLLVRAR